ncbi:MAG: HAMP domain-containing histidine kinase [Clostridia bacterium]|nr:HAMP domain-containing histidine kinase [Clostridia bacterium]
MKKKKSRKLKFNIWFYFLIFTLIIIGVQWFFQMVFLDGYYQRVKISSMRQYASTLKFLVSSPSDFELTVQECRETGVSIFIVGGDDDYSVMYPSDKSAAIDKDLVKSAVGEKLKNGEEGYFGNYVLNLNGSKSKVLYFILDCEYGGNQSYLILISAHAKLTEAVSVFRVQFIIISVLVVIIGFILSWYLTERLSRPLDVMSETAKKWANGDDTVVFEAGDYKEINELADALNYAKEGVSKSGDLQRDLLANVSHDLKTPLTMIKAYAEMIKDISGDNKEKREKHTQVIIDEADRLTLLVNDILNLSKLQSSVDDLNLTEINLSELTERVINRFSDFVAEKGYTIENHVAPELITVADEQKIEQVIYNLLGNSINYTGDDKTVKVFLTAETDKILLEIIDSGKGIGVENIETIWERYYRFSETNSRPVKGTGLGLSIVKAILEKHNLNYGVRTKKDFGSNFFVEFDRIRNE